MDNKEVFVQSHEKPLDNIVEGYSNTSIFRTMAFIGDSLSSGEFETRDKDGNPGYHDMYEYSWGQFLARKNGIMAYNFSKGGMTAKWYLDEFAEKNGFWDKEKSCQAYVIALGVNDVYWQNMEIGSVDDIDKNDYKNNKSTFAGYYAQIISRYKEISPDAKFFFVTIPNENNPNREKISRDMRKLLYDLAEYFDDSYVLDLYEYGPIYDEKFKEKYFLYGHMNPMGYLFTAKIIDSYIDYIIRHNPQDFKLVGFINSNIDYSYTTSQK